MKKMLMLLGAAAVFGWTAQSGCHRAEEGRVADLVLLNGTVWTGESGAPRAEAVAVRAGKIAAVGSNREIRRLAGGAARVLDLGGRLVLPGLIDSHTHFLDGGFALLSLRLRDASSREDFVARIARRAGELGKGGWVLNGDWDHQQFSPPELPRRDWIDAVTSENPVCVNRHDGHMVLVNSLALKIAGVTADTPSPAGGEIVKDPGSGQPTGILKDAAIGLVSRHSRRRRSRTRSVPPKPPSGKRPRTD